MLEELDQLIKYYEKDTPLMDNYWTDGEYEEALPLLKGFKEEDWDKLIEELPQKSDQWKKRLAYCLFDSNNENNLKVLNKMVNTDDVNLLGLVVSHLNKYDFDRIENRELINNKIEELYTDANSIYKNIFDEFLEKKNRNRTR